MYSGLTSDTGVAIASGRTIPERVGFKTTVRDTSTSNMIAMSRVGFTYQGKIPIAPTSARIRGEMRAKEKVIVRNLIAEIVDKLGRVDSHLPGNPYAAKVLTARLLRDLTAVRLG